MLLLRTFSASCERATQFQKVKNKERRVASVAAAFAAAGETWSSSWRRGNCSEDSARSAFLTPASEDEFSWKEVCEGDAGVLPLAVREGDGDEPPCLDEDGGDTARGLLDADEENLSRAFAREGEYGWADIIRHNHDPRSLGSGVVVVSDDICKAGDISPRDDAAVAGGETNASFSGAGGGSAVVDDVIAASSIWPMMKCDLYKKAVWSWTQAKLWSSSPHGLVPRSPVLVPQHDFFPLFVPR